MPDKMSAAALYFSSISPKEKKDLLALYKEYVSFVCNVRDVVYRYKPVVFASYLMTTLYDKEQKAPWSLRYANDAEKKAYQDFVLNNPTADENRCFISLNHTNPSKESTLPSIISAPEKYRVISSCNRLPTRIERSVAAFLPGTVLGKTDFIIEGNYVLNYKGSDSDALLENILENLKTERSLRCMLNMIDRINGNLDISEVEIHTIQNDTMASELLSMFENRILSALATLAESSDNILKKIYYGRYGEEYLRKAGADALIGSPATLQDCLNIRHLLHHQWDTLDTMGKFNAASEKNALMRRRFLESYCRICDRTMLERFNAYSEAGLCFAPLVAALSPELMYRQTNESNTKFIERLKEFKKLNPDACLSVETIYPPSASEKKKALIKNIKKLFKDAVVIDEANMDIDTFVKREAAYHQRENFLSLFQSLEYNLCQYCLFRGVNLKAASAWKYFRTHSLLSAKDCSDWGELRILRNTLSHSYMDEKAASKLDETMPFFIKKLESLEKFLQENRPTVVLIKDNIYEARHTDGTIVTIDFAAHKILNISNPETSFSKKRTPDTIKLKGLYTKEYDNGLSIGFSGDEIISCRFAKGFLVDFKKGRLTYPDGTKCYFSSDTTNCLTFKCGTKILTDKNFKILNCVVEGRPLNLGKNETLRLPSSHLLKTENGCLKKHQTPAGTLEFGVKETSGAITFADKTKLFLPLDNQKPILSHAGIKLTFKTAKKFAETYNRPPLNKTNEKNER